MATVADARARDVGGTFLSVLDASIQTFLDDAALRLNEDAWGIAYDVAHVYLALHLLTMASYGTVGGPITAAAADGISTSFGSVDASGLGSTRWGQLFEDLARARGLIGPCVILGADLTE